jgi:hypothetical protein
VTWQEGQAAQYDFYAAELDKLLVELDNTAAICDTLHEAGMVSETHSYAGGVRALRNSLANASRELRTEPPEQVLPITLTTRRRP